MAQSPFVPLHVHSWYSLLEGVDAPEALLERAAACGYETLALTDTNNLYGMIPFVDAARRQGVRPILGACLRHGGKRVTALAADQEGYRSLCRILSRIHGAVETPASREAALLDLLRDQPAGLHLLVDDVELLAGLLEAYGRRLWLEVVRPARSAARERQLLEAGERLGILPVASIAVHFAQAEGYDTFRLITAVRQGKLLDQVPRRLPIAPEHHLADPDDVQRRFLDLPAALVHARQLAELCRSDVGPRGTVFPPVWVPRAHTPDRYLSLLAERGLRRRLLPQEGVPRGAQAPVIYRRRLDEELTIIAGRGLASYFLAVRDIARRARRQGLDMALRGSAGNSLLCYLLGITNVDPLRHDLPLERFLHPGRPDLPDIDLDFDWKVRDQVIEAAFERHGRAHTAMISTHQFLQPRSAFREAAKVHGLSNAQIAELLETWGVRLPGTWERQEHHALTREPLGPPPMHFPLELERWPRILADARRLLGRPHHLSIHPGGIVITPDEIDNHVPLQVAPKGIVITQLEKDGVERIGLVKIDLLGNRALSTVAEAKKLLGLPAAKAEAGAPCPKTLALLQRGDTLGVNQLESPAMRHLLIQMRPRGVADVIQALALIRPGAASVGAKERFIRRRRGLEPVSHFHPSLEPLLGDTEGLMLYEDDALHVVRALTGYSAPEADHFRKQITKPMSDEQTAELSRQFLTACQKHGVPRQTAEEVWVQLAKFNNYSFCKSHAVSYGLIAWEAAWLKAHAPCPFWTAALNNNQGMYPLRVYVEAAKRMGIRFHLPCVNRSAETFTFCRAEPPDLAVTNKGENASSKGIRIGLASIRGLPEECWRAVLDERCRGGPFRGLADFRRRVEVGPEALGRLIQAGAFDFTRTPRPELVLQAELGPAEGRCEAPGGLFPSECAWDDWQPADYSHGRRLWAEWRLLGLVVGPPLMSLFRTGLPGGLEDTRAIPRSVGREVRLAGLVATGRHVTTKYDEEMQFITLEDEWGLADLVLFPGLCPPLPHLAMGPYMVTGTVEEQHDVLTITARKLERAGPPLALP